MAYPFLNMLSYWTIVPACVLILASFLVEGGAAAAGWTAYPPLSALPEAVPGSGMGQTLWLLAMALFIASFTMGGLNYIATILNCRAKGMGLMRMPLTVWTYFISAILGVLRSAADRGGGDAAARPPCRDELFLPAGLVFGNQTLNHEGGTPLLFQHLFWFLGHPRSTCSCCLRWGSHSTSCRPSRRPPFGYRVSVYSLLVIAFLSMIVWGHHMYVTGMSPFG